jgi:hypothetical protein
MKTSDSDPATHVYDELFEDEKESRHVGKVYKLS